MVAAGALTSGFGLFGGDGAKRQEPRRSLLEAAVAVLNGTAVPGLADAGRKEVVKPAGYKAGTVDNAGSSFANTVVMFAPGREAEAKKLAKAIEPKLGETPTQAMTPDVERARGRRPWRLAWGSTTPGSELERLACCCRSPTCTTSWSISPSNCRRTFRWRRRSPALLLLPLYFSQRRDLQRLHAWMEREPGHPQADIGASEALLDRAETELEALLGTEQAAERRGCRRAGGRRADGGRRSGDRRRRRRPAGPPPAHRVTPSAPPSSGSRRSAPPCCRIRAGAGWSRGSASRGCSSAVAAAAVVLGMAAIFGSERAPQGRRGVRPAVQPGAIVPGEVEVAVLNGTSVPGLAARWATTCEVNGFKLGTVTNSRDADSIRPWSCTSPVSGGPPSGSRTTSG